MANTSRKKPEQVTRWQARDGSLHETERKAEIINARIALCDSIYSVVRSAREREDDDDVSIDEATDAVLSNVETLTITMAEYVALLHGRDWLAAKLTR